MAQIGEPIRRHEVIPIHTPPVETPDGPKREIAPKEPVKEPDKVDYAALRAEIFARFPKILAYLASR